MQKVLVIGAPGSGKSTFSRALAEKTSLPLVHLDLLYCNADQIPGKREVFLSRLEEVLQGDAWIIDGHYKSTLQERLAACDTVFFLDYETDVCLSGIRARRGKARSDLPWVETAEDTELLAFVRAFPTESRPRVLALLFAQRDKTVHIFRSRAEASAFLAKLS